MFMTLLCVLYVALVQYVNFSYVRFLLYTCIVVLTVWTIGRVLVLCAAFLCLSNWLMLLLNTIILPLCQLLKLNGDYDDDDDV